MGSDTYHEPLGELSQKTRDLHRGIVSLIEELEAIDWYQQRADACTDEALKRVLDGPVLWAPAVPGAVILSVRGGDFVLTLGQDLSIGYADHDRQDVELYLVESLAFRVLEGSAAVHVRPS
jgi:uncharacterized linocin/CFP29 family protein